MKGRRGVFDRQSAFWDNALVRAPKMRDCPPAGGSDPWEVFSRMDRHESQQPTTALATHAVVHGDDDPGQHRGHDDRPPGVFVRPGARRKRGAGWPLFHPRLYSPTGFPVVRRVAVGLDWAAAGHSYWQCGRRAVVRVLSPCTVMGLVSLPAPWIGARLWEAISPIFPFYVPLVAMAAVLPVMWFKFKLPPGSGQSTDQAASTTAESAVP